MWGVLLRSSLTCEAPTLPLTPLSCPGRESCSQPPLCAHTVSRARAAWTQAHAMTASPAQMVTLTVLETSAMLALRGQLGCSHTLVTSPTCDPEDSQAVPRVSERLWAPGQAHRPSVATA